MFLGVLIAFATLSGVPAKGRLVERCAAALDYFTKKHSGKPSIGETAYLVDAPGSLPTGIGDNLWFRVGDKSRLSAPSIDFRAGASREKASAIAVCPAVRTYLRANGVEVVSGKSKSKRGGIDKVHRAWRVSLPVFSADRQQAMMVIQGVNGQWKVLLNRLPNGTWIKYAESSGVVF